MRSGIKDRMFLDVFIKTEVSMVTANFAAIAGFSLIAVALVAVFFSPYRRWLGFMLAGTCKRPHGRILNRYLIKLNA